MLKKLNKITEQREKLEEADSRPQRGGGGQSDDCHQTRGGPGS